MAAAPTLTTQSELTPESTAAEQRTAQSRVEHLRTEVAYGRATIDDLTTAEAALKVAALRSDEAHRLQEARDTEARRAKVVEYRLLKAYVRGDFMADLVPAVERVADTYTATERAVVDLYDVIKRPRERAFQAAKLANELTPEELELRGGEHLSAGERISAASARLLDAADRVEGRARRLVLEAIAKRLGQRTDRVLSTLERLLFARGD